MTNCLRLVLATLIAVLFAPIEARASWWKRCLTGGPDVNAHGPDGSTALMKATLWRRVDIVHLLLSRGANVHADDDRGWTALSIAKTVGHRELIELLERETK